MNERQIILNDFKKYCNDGGEHKLMGYEIKHILAHINNLQSKIDKANKILDKYAKTEVEDYKKIMKFYKELRDVLKEDK